MISKLARLRPPNWHNHGLQLYLQTRSIRISECISKFIRSRPPSESPITLDYGLQVRTITASKCIFKLTQSQPPSVSLNSHDRGFQVSTIMAANCISKLARSGSRSASLSSLDHGLEVYAQIHSIMASKFARSRPPSASPKSLDHGIQVHLQGATAGVRKYRGSGGGYSDWEYIFGRPRSRETSSHFHLILSYNENTLSIFPNFWSHSLCPSCHGSMQLRGSSTPGSIISSHLILILVEPEPLFLMNSVWMSRALCLLAPSFHHNGLQVVHL